MHIVYPKIKHLDAEETFWILDYYCYVQEKIDWTNLSVWLEEWEMYPIDKWELFMRERNDNRPDEVVKKEIFNEHIRDNYCVSYVIDDRQKVCNMWRSLWLRCLQVDEWNF